MLSSLTDGLKSSEGRGLCMKRPSRRELHGNSETRCRDCQKDAFTIRIEWTFSGTVAAMIVSMIANVIQLFQ